MLKDHCARALKITVLLASLVLISATVATASPRRATDDSAPPACDPAVEDCTEVGDDACDPAVDESCDDVAADDEATGGDDDFSGDDGDDEVELGDGNDVAD